MTYTIDQVAQYAYNAGFRGTALVQATAVAMAESGGNSDAKSSDGYGSVGLWQFIPSTWAGIAKSPFTNASDPQQNANAAFKLYQQNGQSFAGQWSTWPGAAAKFMPAATVAAGKVSATGGGTSDPSTPAVQTASVTNVSNPLTSWVKPVIEFFVSAGMVAGGLALILFGLRFTFKEVA